MPILFPGKKFSKNKAQKFKDKMHNLKVKHSIKYPATNFLDTHKKRDLEKMT